MRHLLTLQLVGLGSHLPSSTHVRSDEWRLQTPCLKGRQDPLTSSTALVVGLGNNDFSGLVTVAVGIPSLHQQNIQVWQCNEQAEGL
jgi:hypothetical protein